ncbi:MAG TPA: hypothetical protein VFR01_07735, partial [Geobacterales bacterium]|nr:hypothetical protein [Geobacterales bacterium]
FGRKEILRAGELLHQGGIPVSWYLLVGAPGETRQTLADTFDTISAAASPWDLIIIGVSIRLYKGSDLAQAQQEILPACTEDNFLHPFTFIPEALTLAQIKTFSRFRALQHSNYYLYDEDEGDAGLSLALGSLLLRIFAPGQPIWRLYILLRRLQGLLGIAAIKRALFRRQLRRSMSEEFCTSSLR